jgi:hypothetical protein
MEKVIFLLIFVLSFVNCHAGENIDSVLKKMRETNCYMGSAVSDAGETPGQYKLYEIVRDSATTGQLEKLLSACHRACPENLREKQAALQGLGRTRRSKNARKVGRAVICDDGARQKRDEHSEAFSKYKRLKKPISQKQTKRRKSTNTSGYILDTLVAAGCATLLFLTGGETPPGTKNA